jgi:hypothetical protein
MLRRCRGARSKITKLPGHFRRTHPPTRGAAVNRIQTASRCIARLSGTGHLGARDDKPDGRRSMRRHAAAHQVTRDRSSSRQKVIGNIQRPRSFKRIATLRQD